MPSGRGVALALSGAGAHGAYEIGALSILLPELERRGEEVTLLCGTSAGAINAALLGSLAHLPAATRVALAIERWQRIARAEALGSLRSPAVPLKAARMTGEALGVPGVRADGLLESRPLRRFLERQLDWDGLHRNVGDGTVDAVCVVATELASGTPCAFVETERPLEPPARGELAYVRSRVTSRHVLASATRPPLRSPVRLGGPHAGEGRYADGRLRLGRPLAPALDLGADRVVAVGFAPPDARPRSWPLAEVARRRVAYAFVAPPDERTLRRLVERSLRHRCGGVRGATRPEVALAAWLLRGRTRGGGDLLSILALTLECVDTLVAAGRRDASRWMRAHPGVWCDETPTTLANRGPASLDEWRRRPRPQRERQPVA